MKVQHETLQTQTEQLLEDIAFEIFIGKTIYHEHFKQMSLEYDPHDGMDFDCEKNAIDISGRRSAVYW